MNLITDPNFTRKDKNSNNSKISKRRSTSFIRSYIGTISGALRRLVVEYNTLIMNPFPNITAGPKLQNMLEWSAIVIGPENSFYKNGRFFFDINFPESYPLKPPTVICRTKIFHCNINSQGIVCMDILNENWSPILSLNKIFLCLVSLLTECNPNDPLVGNLGNLYLCNKDEYIINAREWTDKYAL